MADLPANPVTRRARTYEALARAVEGAPSAAPEDQLVQAIVEAKQLAFVLRRLEVELTPRLELRARLIREGLEEGLREALDGIA